MDNLNIPQEKRASLRAAFRSDRENGTVDPVLSDIADLAQTLGFAGQQLKNLPEDAQKLASAAITSRLADVTNNILAPGHQRSTGEFDPLDPDTMRKLQDRKAYIQAIYSDGGNTKNEAVEKQLAEMMAEIKSMKETKADEKYAALEAKLDKIITSGAGAGTPYAGLSPAQALVAKTQDALTTINDMNALVGRPPVKNLADLAPADGTIDYTDPGYLKYYESKGYQITPPMTQEQMLQKIDVFKNEFMKHHLETVAQVRQETEEQTKQRYNHIHMILKTVVGAVTGLMRGVVGHNGGMEQGLATIDNLFNNVMDTANPGVAQVAEEMAAEQAAPTVVVMPPTDAATEAAATRLLSMG